jgi:hypothetical protein
VSVLQRQSKNHVLLFSVFAIICFFITAFLFSFQQNLWVDETTQLSGLGLSFTEIYLWLSDLIETPFSVPSDRMPVLSYWFGMLWSYFFTLDVLVMRWLSLFFVMLALVILCGFFFKRQQYSVLLAATLFLCLSPNLTVLAVEIRAYALFFLFSVIAVLLYVQIICFVEQERNAFTSALALSCVLVLAINTHFFGLVLAGSLLAAYLLMALWDRRFVLHVKIIFAVGTILLLGTSFVVLPVIGAFASQGGGAEASVAASSLQETISLRETIRSAVKLAYRLVAHQTMGEIAFFPLLALLIVYGVIILSVIKHPTVMKTVLLLALLLGCMTVFLANIFLSSFDALAPHYNVWMLPLLAVLFGYAVGDLLSAKRAYMITVLGVVGATCGYGQWTLAFSGEKYAHTRFSEIQQRVESYSAIGAIGGIKSIGEIERSVPLKISIVYNRSMAKTWFAGIYTFPRSVNQYVVEQADTGLRAYISLYDGEAISAFDVAEHSDIIISAYGETIYSAELNASEHAAPVREGHPVFEQIAPPEPMWRQLEAMTFLAQESANIVVYKKTP